MHREFLLRIARVVLATAWLDAVDAQEQPARQVEDAAPGYRAAVAALRRATTAPDESRVDAPEPASDELLGEALRAFLATTVEARTAFVAASGHPACRFEPVGTEPGFVEFDDVSFDLLHCAELVAFDGRRALEDGAVADAVAAECALLGFARHAMATTTVRGIAFGGRAEDLALELERRIAATAGDAPAAARAAVVAHVAARPTLELVELAVRTEVQRIATAFLDAAVEDASDDAMAKRFRPVAREVRREVEGLLDALTPIIEKARTTGDEAAFDAIAPLVKGWRAELPKSLADVEKLPEAERARLLGRWLMLLATPDVARLGTEFVAGGRRLAQRAAERN